MPLSVVILGLDGRRRTLKVEQNDVILKTLQDFCQKEGLDSSLYEFSFQQKPLNATLTWRFANIPNNAKLGLEKQDKKRAENPVRIALQIPGVKRVQHSFIPSTTFVEILKQFDDVYASEIKDGMSAGILYVQKEYFGLQLNDSLKSVGLTGGSALLKIIQKSNDEVEAINANFTMTKRNVKSKIINKSSNSKIKAETHSSECNETIADPKPCISSSSVISMAFEEQVDDTPNQYTNRRSAQTNSEETARKKFKASPSPSPPPQTSFENFKFPEQTVNMDLRNQDNLENVQSHLRAFAESCDREVVFYDELKGRKTTEIDELSDDFYEVTINDLKMMLTDLRSIQKEAENKPLLTKISKQRESLKAMKMYPKIIIRIVFPKRLILQGIFQPGEPTQNLYNFVSTHLNSKDMPFYLYTTPPKIILDEMDKSLFDYKLSPASKVYFKLKAGNFSPAIFNGKTLSKVQTVVQANEKVFVVYESVNKESRLKDDDEESVMDDIPSTSSRTSTNNLNVRRQTSSNTKVPKWFKLGKK